ncbi:MAG: 30S ribosomal protein THX [Bacteroidetes bacterium]|nr:30S ribosomal protein THX [Bacteroidota bacterium]
MGRGDKRTKRGKIFAGSYGVSRPHKPNKGAAAVAIEAAAKEKPAKAEKTAKKAPAKKAAAPKKKAAEE